MNTRKILMLMLIAVYVCFLSAGVGLAGDVNVEFVGSYDATEYGYTIDVAISGTYAYIAGVDGLVVIDISNPTAPMLAGNYNTAGSAEGVAVSGNYAYVAHTYDGLAVIDINNPTAPVLAGNYNTAGYASDVVVSGSYAYVADDDNGLVVIDINNPTAPVLAGNYNTAGYAEGVAVSGNYAYVADDGNGLVVIDISNPAAPVLAGGYNTAGYASDVAVSGSHAYVADDGNGLVVIDISNPAAPMLVGTYDNTDNMRGVAVSGNYAYIAGGNGLVVIDISNPAAPVLAGSYDNAEDSINVAVSGSYAYIVDFYKGLVILQMSGQNTDSKFTFVQLTDVHVGSDPMSYLELNEDIATSLARTRTESINNFIKLREEIIGLDPKPDFVLITGDLVEWNHNNNYRDLNMILDVFNDNSIKVYTVPGNHDRRGTTTFTSTRLDFLNTIYPINNLNNYQILDNWGQNEVRFDKSDEIINHNGYRFIGLDSGYDAYPTELMTELLGYDLITITNSINNFIKGPKGTGLSVDQIDFLNDNIIDDKTIIFMHHPAINENTGQSVINRNRNQFVNLAASKNVKLVLTGHTHSPKFHDSDGNSYIYNNNEIIPLKYPLFVQARSATKGASPGYLLVNVDNEEISIQDKIIDTQNSESTTLSVHSPADLHVYDEFGRHTGLNDSGGIDGNIPDSYYFEQYTIGNITLPAFVTLYNTTLNYSYEIVANFSKENITLNQASFSFIIEHATSNSTTTIDYNNVPIYNDSRAYMQINTTQTDYSMQIDLDNDSFNDNSKMPDSIITDYAPKAVIIFPNNNSVWDQGQPITFNGTAFDSEDGTLTSLIWISDRNDIIGHGNFTTTNLSAGMHNIILQVSDSVNQVNTSDIVIFINDTIHPILKIEYPPENKTFNVQNITVNGIAYDDSGISNVSVNGIQAGIENWNTTIELTEGKNTLKIVATDNEGFNTTDYRTVIYNSSLSSDTSPPVAVTDLTHETGIDNSGIAWINWTWNNPINEDFSYVIIDMDDIPMEHTSNSYFNITGLSDNADYKITILSADIVDNINYTIVTETVRTPRNFPPFSITGLDSTAGTTWINWTWINPDAPDFGYTEIYLDSIIKGITSDDFFNATNLDLDTEYTISTRTVDSAGNINETWINNTAKTNEEINNDVNTASSGGGSGSSGEAFENIAVKDVVRMYVAKDNAVTYEFKEDVNPIGFVSFDAKTNVGYITATVEVLKNTSAIVSSEPSGEVYQNMNIWIGLAGFATENNIANPVIGFKVLKSWINENDIDESTIKLNRYNLDAWGQLPTTKTNEDGNYIYFSSETPGFSPFAITGDQRSSIVVANVQDSSDTSSVAKDRVKDSDVKPVDIPDYEDESSGGLTALVGLIGILIISVGVILKKEEIGKWINQRRS